jgi:Bacteriophage replication protein O/DnaA N-terminal domain
MKDKCATSEAYLKIEHSIAELLSVCHFSEQQRRILDLIFRLSWACGKKTAYIPHQRDFEVIGVREGHIKAHIDWLVAAFVIVRRGCYYSINKDFAQWQVNRAEKYNPGKFRALVGLNLRTPDPEFTNVIQLTENGSSNLRKMEVGPYAKGKFLTPDLASPKELLNKYIHKKTIPSDSISENLPPAAENFSQTAAETWAAVLGLLRPQVNAANYATWLKNTQALLCRNHVFTLRVPNPTVAEYLDTHLRSLIEKTIIDVTHVDYKIAFDLFSSALDQNFS